jgi:hypothetical protein
MKRIQFPAQQMQTGRQFRPGQEGGASRIFVNRLVQSAAAFGPEHDPEKWAPVFRKDHAQTK